MKYVIYVILLCGYLSVNSLDDFLIYSLIILVIYLWLNRDADVPLTPEMQKRLDVHKYFLDNNRYPPDADPKIIDEAKKMYAEYLADKASEQPDTKICPKCMEEIKYLARKCPHCTADI